VAWIQGDCASDSDTNQRGSFRTVPTSQYAIGSGNNQHTNQAAIYNTTLWEDNNQSLGFIHFPPGLIQLMVYNSAQITTNVIQPYLSTLMNRWYDGSVNLSEPIIGWSAAAASTSNEALAIGYLWDAIIYNDHAPLGKTFTIDGHNWVNVMENQGYFGANNGVTARCALLLATS